jgi:hypothetical protein
MAAAICQLGDATLTSPYYPGYSIRPNGVGVNSGNNVAFGSYPATTPDNITKLIRPAIAVTGAKVATILTGPCGCFDRAIVTAGSPPNFIPGSPFDNDTFASTPYAVLYPRWTGETAWDLQNFTGSEAFTPQGIGSPGVLNYSTPVIGTAARFGVSLGTSALPNDPSLGGITIYAKQARWKFFVNADEVCCWNNGYQIEVNLEIWKVPVTATYQSGTVGAHDFTLGTPSYETTMSQTLVIDYTWDTGGTFIQLGTNVDIPQVTNYFTYVNDFYISSVTAP